MTGAPSFNQVVWLDRGWQPAYIGFCPSKRAWSTAMRKLGVKGQVYPTSSGCVTSFEKTAGIGGLTLIVTLGPQSKAASRVEVAGLLCHEATHVWQAVRNHMGENSPSIEFEAYSMQAIFQGLYQAWLDTCAPAEQLAAGARRVKAEN